MLGLSLTRSFRPAEQVIDSVYSNPGPLSLRTVGIPFKSTSLSSKLQASENCLYSRLIIFM